MTVKARVAARRAYEPASELAIGPEAARVAADVEQPLRLRDAAEMELPREIAAADEPVIEQWPLFIRRLLIIALAAFAWAIVIAAALVVAR